MILIVREGEEYEAGPMKVEDGKGEGGSSKGG